MRLPRPHIPLAIRVIVAERQLAGINYEAPAKPLGERLRKLLTFLGVLQDTGHIEKMELHHRPALVNRRRYVRNGKTFYDPPANDPDHLVYLLEDDHDVETRVRGQHGQYSDLALARKRRRKERKARRRSTRFPKRRIRVNRLPNFTISVNKSAPKRKWPKRSLHSTDRPLHGTTRWPKRKMRLR